MLLRAYSRAELEAIQKRVAEAEKLAAQAKLVQANKLIADALLPSFALTGSDLPADCNPAQLHLF
jgi:hypothetical protein